MQAVAGVLNQGSGNYGNHVLFIGRRNMATFPSNMQLHQLIARGAATALADLEPGETFVTSKL